MRHGKQSRRIRGSCSSLTISLQSAVTGSTGHGATAVDLGHGPTNSGLTTNGITTAGTTIPAMIEASHFAIPSVVGLDVPSDTDGLTEGSTNLYFTNARADARISAADLQVLYRAWNNKIKVSASGYKPESVKVSCNGCRITPKPDKDGFYTATTLSGSRAKECFISVSATDDNGANVELAKERFRIFPLPKPTVYFGGKAGGSIKKVQAAQVKKLVGGGDW